MADSPPTKDNHDDKPKFTGGWRKPSQPGAWREPEAPAAGTTWRVISTLPKHLDVEPPSQGVWHLPRPEHTTYTPSDEIRVSEPATEAAIPAADETSAPVVPQSTLAAPEDYLLLGQDDEQADTQALAKPEPVPVAPEDLILGLEQETEAQPEPETEITPLPSEPATAVEPDSLLALELEAETQRPDGDLASLEDEDEDEGGMGMSELIALASLVEQAPQSEIRPGAAGSAGAEAAAPAGQATGQQAAVEDQTLSQTGAQAQDYASEQLRKLGIGAASGESQPAAASTAAANQVESYAQEQLRKLGLTGAAPASTGATGGIPVVGAAPVSASPAALTPEQQALATKFRDTQDQVRAMREAIRANQLRMSRDELQAELRKLMVLDEQGVWWMMGVETDTWYRFENGNWVADVPPLLAAVSQEPPRAGTPPTLTSDFRQPVQVGGFGDYTQPSAAFQTPSEPLAATQLETQLPRSGVPIQDMDRTVVSQVGAFVGQAQPEYAETVPGMGRVTDTILNQRLDVGGMAAPADMGFQPAEVAPDYAMEAPSPSYEEVLRSQRQRTTVNLIRLAVIGFALLLLLGAGVVGLVLIQYSNIASRWQPQIAALANYQPQFQTVRVLDANGSLIVELNSQDGGARTNVQLQSISPFVIHAVVSLENERYFQDPGWDWIAIIRAFVQNVGAGGVESGASTITQQIARQLILQDTTVSPLRKLDEIVIASEIAKQYDKNFILQLYLNEIFFGNQSYGIEAAAQFYFNKSANDLNLPESAMLAGVIATPANYDPVRRAGEDNATYGTRRDATFGRMDFVLQRMVTVGCLQFQHAPYLNQPFCVTQQDVNRAAADTARVESRNYVPRDVTFKYPHFVEFVRQYVDTNLPGQMFRQGFVIKTTLIPSIQDVAETALDNQMVALVATNVNTGAIIVTDPRTGAIRAMIGSPDFNNADIDGMVNGALTWQQPGSSIKPIVYTGALEGLDKNGDGQLDFMTAASILWDVPTTFPNTVPPYSPVNFDGRFRGPVPFRLALQNSLNLPSVKVYDFIGPNKFQDVATRMGLRFRDDAQFGLATGLGATEVTLYDMAVAYGTLANNGIRTPLYAVESITTADGVSVPLPGRVQPAQALQPQTAYIMQNILSDDTARADQFGTGGWMTIPGLPTSNYVAAKTGTTDRNRDLWTVGFTRSVVVGVWLGRPDDGQTFVQGGGYNNVGPLWQQVMAAAIRGTNPQPFTNPGGVVEVQICRDTGTLPPPNCRALRTELFLQNQLPPAAEQAFIQQVAIDTWTGLRGNTFCPDNQIQGTFLNVPDQAAIQWLGTAPGLAYLSQLGLSGNAIQSVPTAACDTNTDVPIARMVSPTDNQTVSGNITVTGAASAAAFNRYQLEVAAAGTPNNFVIISGPVTAPQTSGTLGTWNTATVPNGAYILRLAMFASNGGYLYRTMTVNVNNAVPTPTPTVPAPQITPIPTFSFQEVTPLPFDQVQPPAP